MVISCLTLYVVAFSSVFLLGKSCATTTPAPMDVTSRQSDRRNTKIHFQTHVKNNGTMDIVEGSKPDQKLKVLQSSFLPSNGRKESNGFAKHGNATHSYFALYDPVNNVTEALEVSGQDLPSNIRYSDFSGMVRSRMNSGKLGVRGNEGLYLEDLNSESRRKIRNFIEWDTLRDSEKEVRIHYNGITAKETVVRTGTDEETGKRISLVVVPDYAKPLMVNPSMVNLMEKTKTKQPNKRDVRNVMKESISRQGLKLRQLTDGRHFIQLIYNFDNEIQDCEYIKQKPVIRNFLKFFRKNFENAREIYENELKVEGLGEDLEKSEKNEDVEDEDDDDYVDEGKIEKYSLNEDLEQYEGEDLNSEKEYRNVTFQIINRDERLPREFAEWMNYSKLKQKCRENHRILKRLAFDKKHGDAFAKKLAEEHIERMKRSLDFPLIFPGTKWCGKSHIADKYTALGGFSKTDKCCRAHDHCHPLISSFEEKYGFYNFRPYTLNHCRCDLRRKRDIMDVLLVPGTKWCGKGRRATKYTSLGGFSRTDKCCRVHDTMCPHWIGSLEEKYGFFNWRINTIMHCRCDKRFRACLKMAKTGTANFVGKLFFNVVQTKCFVLKPQEVCLSYSWWGKCEKKEYRKKAYLRDNLSY